MFKRLNIFWFLCCSALLSGCVNTPINFWHISTEQLIEHHHYQTAIEKISATVPIDQALLRKVKKMAKQQQKKQTSKTSQLIKQKKWGEAREVLSKLNANQPNLAVFTALSLLIDKA